MTIRQLALPALALLLGFGLRGACRPPQPVEPEAIRRSDSLAYTGPEYAKGQQALRDTAQRWQRAAEAAKREADRLRVVVKSGGQSFTRDSAGQRSLPSPGMTTTVPNPGTIVPDSGMIERWRFDTLSAAYDSLAVAYRGQMMRAEAESTRADRAEQRLAVSEATRGTLAAAVKRASECRFLGVRTGFCLRFAVVAGPGVVVTPQGRVYGGASIAAGIRLNF